MSNFILVSSWTLLYLFNFNENFVHRIKIKSIYLGTWSMFKLIGLFEAIYQTTFDFIRAL